MQSSARIVTGQLFKLLVIATVLFLLLELSTRVYLFGLAGLIPSRINSVHELPQTGFLRPSSEVGLGFELKPGLDAWFKLAPFVTNSQGLRDREYTLHKPENTFRVAVVGASFALPAGIAIEDAFHSVLERRLSRELAPLRFEFINFSVGMYGPEQVLTMLETRALAYDPDLVLFSATSLSTPHLIDERSPGASPQKAPVPIRFRRSYPILQSFFIRLLRLRAARGQVEPGLYTGRLEEAYMWLLECWRSDEAGGERSRRSKARSSRGADVASAQGGGSILDRLASLSQTSGVPIVVVRLEYDGAPKLPVDLAVERAAAARGVPYLDTRDAFVGTRARDLWIYELDPHPNARAHEIFADAIATFLRSKGLVPSPDPQGRSR